MKIPVIAVCTGLIVIAGIVLYPRFFSEAPDGGMTASAERGAAASGGRPGSGPRGRPAPLVRVEAVSEALANDRLKTLGNGLSSASVSVVPLSGGILSSIEVAAGEQVEQNQLLATLDDAEQLIAREQASSTLNEARDDVTRLERLFRSRTTTEVELNRARAALRRAELGLRDAELQLARRSITAPISGTVGFISMDPGNWVSAHLEIMTIDDRSTIDVEFWIPERFANQISLQQTVSAVALADPGTKYTGVVSAIGSRIDPNSRTLKVSASIDNRDDRLRPGMAFDIFLSFAGQRFDAVAPLAVQWDSTGSFVWRITDNKAERVPVSIIQRNPEAVLVNAELNPGELVVTEGVLRLRPGAAVRVEGDRPTSRPERGADSTAVQSQARVTLQAAGS